MSTTSKKQLNFTKKSLEGLPVPEKGKRSYYHDTKCRGLTICIYASGKRTFQLYRKIHGKPERITLGHFPDMTVENARKKAQIVNAEIADGKNPNDARRALREEMTLRELHDKFINDYARLHKKSYQADQKLFNLHLSCWEDRKLSRITNQDIRQLHQRLGSENGRIVANRVYALIHTMFNKAIEWNLCQGNPASGIKKFKETSRERFLEADEIPAFFQALQLEQNHTIRDYFFISLFVGARRSNILAMQWDEINFTTKVWRIPDTKSGEAVSVPLSEAAMDILLKRREKHDSPYVFPSKTSTTGHLVEPKKGWARVLKRAGIKKLRIHDLRRSLGSWQAATGASLPIIGKSLGHKSIQATQIYARLNIDPVRQSIETATAAIFEAAKVKG